MSNNHPIHVHPVRPDLLVINDSLRLHLTRHLTGASVLPILGNISWCFNVVFRKITTDTHLIYSAKDRTADVSGEERRSCTSRLEASMGSLGTTVCTAATSMGRCCWQPWL